MRSLRDQKCRTNLTMRLQSLSLDSKPSWGRMNVGQMLSHLVQSNEMPFVSCVPDESNWFSRTLLKPLVLYVLPVPKEVKTPAPLDQQQDGRKPVGFDVDKKSVIELIEKLGTIKTDHECLAHPFFGAMSAKQWAVMAHKHIDHHLRQFGV